MRKGVVRGGRWARGAVCAGLATGLLLAGAGCGPEPQILRRGAADPSSGSLQVAAGGDTGGDAGTVVVVSANRARTFAGHFAAGQRVRLEVLDTAWTPEPGEKLFGADGVPGRNCEARGGSPCPGEHLPLLGLVLFVASSAPQNVNRDATCMGLQRIAIPTGAEMEMPVDGELSLGPNDWEDGLDNNSGAIEVVVERSLKKESPILERAKVSVSATSAATSAGTFRRGEYVRITVQGGRWTNDPSVPPVGSEGNPKERCGAAGHTCVAGEGKPLMVLVMQLSCSSISQRMMPLQRIDRSYIPRGTEITLATESDLFLGPNDNAEGLPDNSGSARVRVVPVRAR
ncbi:MAG: hypothetical protein R3B70_27940 [Polyangiaceae bacterium]